MGLYCCTISFKGPTQDAVVAAIRTAMPQRRCFVSPSVNGWVTVFDAACDWGDEEEIGRLCGAVCPACRCAALALAVIQSDFLFYWLFDRQGRLRDRSFPPEADKRHLNREECLGLTGRPERLAKVAPPGVSGEQIRSALAEPHLFRDDNLYHLARLLGIAHVGFDYHWVVRNRADIDAGLVQVEGWPDFVHLNGD